MSVGLGPMIIRDAPVCEGSPTISTIGAIAVQSDDECGGVGEVTYESDVTLSGALDTNQTVEDRWSDDNGSSYGSWATTFSSGSSGTATYTKLGTETDTGNPSTSYDLLVQFRVIGTDGSTVCDGPDTVASALSVTVYDCTA